MNRFLFISPIYTVMVCILTSLSVSSCSKSSVPKDREGGPEIPPVDIVHPLEESFPAKDFSYPGAAYDLTESLPAGYVTDGSVDYTTYLQDGLDDNPIVVFPNFPIMINTPGLRVRSNAQVYFREHSKLRMKGVSSGHYYMILLLDAKDVLLKNICLEGDRNRHLGTTGEWGMGIYISGCENITVDHATITNCWGDGVYLGQDSWNDASQSVVIRNSIIDSNRRAGISIISGKNVTIDHCIVKNTNGPLISSGITLEPNARRNDIDNISITNSMTINNQKIGIRITTANLYGTEGGIKKSDIQINNYKDKGSQFGISFVLGHPSKIGGITGTIRLDNIICQDNLGHAVVNYTSVESDVLYNAYFKDVYPIKGSTLNTVENNYFKKLVDNTAYFFWE